MDVTLVVVPIQCSNVSFAPPIARKFVMLFECILEMLYMFFANVFYAKIIENQCELYGSCAMLPKSRYQFALLYPCLLRRFQGVHWPIVLLEGGRTCHA